MICLNHQKHFFLFFLAIGLGITAVSAQTFTVNSTGDAADANLDGICATAGNVCTLRAAIEEVNSHPGTNTIDFNIPTSDSGFVNYDTPNTSSSGSVSNGKSYWTIHISSPLPAINVSDTTINALTQTTNQGDYNTFGPEVEIKADSGVATIFNLGTSITGTIIKGFILNGSNTQIQSTSGASMVTIQNNYVCTDAKGLGTITPVGSGIYFAGNSFIIRNNVVANCGNVGLNISGGDIIGIYGNKIAVDSTGINALNTNSFPMSISSATNVSIGSSNNSDQNIIGSYTDGNQAFASVYLSDVSGTIINNFIGTDSTKTKNFSNVASYVGISIEAHNTNNNLQIGNSIKPNYIRNVYTAISFGGYYGSANLNSTLTFENNEIMNTTHGFDLWDDNSKYGPINDKVQLIIKNNKIDNNQYGIYNFSGSPQIYGNEIKDNSKWAIFNWVDFYTPPYDPSQFAAKPLIGGATTYTGSLCNGLKKNCISGNGWGGIYSIETVPWNESTLYTDNDFGTGNGSSNNRDIEQSWYGLFELFRNSNRRTDLANGSRTYSFPSNTIVKTSDDPSSRVTTGTNLKADCPNISNCPASGSSAGESGKTELIAPSSATLSDISTWYQITQYIYDHSGTKNDYENFTFNSNGLSSPKFSFDGNSTTDPLSADIGVPWTNDTNADRTVQNSTISLGRYEIMNVNIDSSIYDLNVAPDTTSTVITWKTSEFSSTQIEYGLTSSYGSQTSETDNSVKLLSHSVSLSGLTPCTLYHYRAKGTDAFSQLINSNDSTFTTTGCPSPTSTPIPTNTPIITTTIPTSSTIITIGGINKTITVSKPIIKGNNTDGYKIVIDSKITLYLSPDNNGNWSVILNSDLSDGTHKVTVYDKSGKVLGEESFVVSTLANTGQNIEINIAFGVLIIVILIYFNYDRKRIKGTYYKWVKSMKK